MSKTIIKRCLGSKKELDDSLVCLFVFKLSSNYLSFVSGVCVQKKCIAYYEGEQLRGREHTSKCDMEFGRIMVIEDDILSGKSSQKV